ncbi:hypothetical protein [Flaviaesturariibacter amylovorans]|uniref:Uncharacterized protein n=1 Tax=Flaviaesturariibacter amylovorans TaxID=1084520 RepID=A0ABP8HLI5_9BACT
MLLLYGLYTIAKVLVLLVVLPGLLVWSLLYEKEPDFDALKAAAEKEEQERKRLLAEARQQYLASSRRRRHYKR